MTDRCSAELERLVQEALSAGEYASRNELLLEAVQLLVKRNRRRDQLRDEIRKGLDQLDRGEYTEYDKHSLRRRIDDLKDRVRRKV